MTDHQWAQLAVQRLLAIARAQAAAEFARLAEQTRKS